MSSVTWRIEDDDNDDDHCSLPHPPASGSSSDICHSPSHPPSSDTPGLNSDSVCHSPSHSSPSDTPDTLPCWTSTLTPVTITPFTSPVGPKVAIPESPSDIFQLMFTPALLDSIVEQSNLYTKEVMGEKYSSWVKITSEELKAYLGFCILMGINHLPALDDYWSTDPALHYSPVADRITRDRFWEISCFLHNSTLTLRGSPGYDRLGKVQPVVNHLSSCFSDLYDPHRAVAVDEAVIKFTGHSSLKQYMPMKPIK